MVRASGRYKLKTESFTTASYISQMRFFSGSFVERFQELFPVVNSVAKLDEYYYCVRMPWHGATEMAILVMYLVQENPSIYDPFLVILRVADV